MGTKNKTPPPRTGRVLSRLSRPAEGGGGHADGGGRQREEGTPGRDNPGANRDLIVKAEDGKWGATGQGKADTDSHKELFGIPSRGGKRRRAVETGRRGRRPGRRSLRARASWGGRSGCKERDKRRRRVKDGRR